eukprot:CAMPEP_0178439748 /NCGR_PEP_ID=MMETSP0689_2-20121128/36343_1 /TAXON_ID=160604 /ORGANISM="Amphidinium massartii, Strain CS-259" /LENGTH=91 /DNA_ID=CAMNT_0020062341 /DNA_START=245 /DNA_END=521 /DNA_ORIENTATION=+
MRDKAALPGASRRKWGRLCTTAQRCGSNLQLDSTWHPLAHSSSFCHTPVCNPSSCVAHAALAEASAQVAPEVAEPPAVAPERQPQECSLSP